MFKPRNEIKQKRTKFINCLQFWSCFFCHFTFICRYPINHVDDFLTETWFIVLLGSILAIIIMSFGAMVFVKRKHMLMKQGALGKYDLFTFFWWYHRVLNTSKRNRISQKNGEKRSVNNLCIENNLWSMHLLSCALNFFLPFFSIKIFAYVSYVTAFK